MELTDKLALKPEEVGRLLGFSRAKVYEMMRRGELPFVELGNVKRIPRSALEALLAANTRGGKEAA